VEIVEDWTGFLRTNLLFSETDIRPNDDYVFAAVGLNLREAKAWSQNLGHEKPMTTWTSNGKLEDSQTGEVMAGLVNNHEAESE